MTFSGLVFRVLALRNHKGEFIVFVCSYRWVLIKRGFGNDLVGIWRNSLPIQHVTFGFGSLPHKSGP